jgi:hypothetical protein
VFIQYPANKKESGYVECHYLNGVLVDKITEGTVVSDYSYLKEQAAVILTKAYELLKQKHYK